MRVFIGIKLADRVHEEIEEFLKPFKKASTPIRWVNPGNVHITLKFIGEISPEKYTQIEKRLGELHPDTGPLDLKLAGCGKFGRGNSLNIFWIGIAPNEGLNEIYRQIENALAKLGIPKEDRPFKPHITVGRNKKDTNFKSFFQLMEEKGSRPISEFTAGHFQVFKSDLKPEGPVYTVLKEIPLG